MIRTPDIHSRPSDLEDAVQTVYHGYAGNLQSDAFRPPITVAISRETGSRGKTVARRTAELLDWRFIDQEMLEFLCQASEESGTFEEGLPEDARQWMESRIDQIFSPTRTPPDPLLIKLVSSILEYSVRGKCVLLGRGAGCILPPLARLNIRLVAPRSERIAYISQWQRLSSDLAAQFVEQRDNARQQFVTDIFGLSPSDLAQYDLVLNTSTLGVEGCAQTIVTAVRQWEIHHAGPSADAVA